MDFVAPDSNPVNAPHWNAELQSAELWFAELQVETECVTLYAVRMFEQPFSWFDPRRAVRVYHGNLPHWRRDDGLYFMTFRLADSIPKRILAEWDGDRRAWMEAHGIRGYPDSSGWQEEFGRLPEDKRRMFSRMNAKRLFAELDQCGGECWLRNDSVREVLMESMHHFDGSRWRIGDFVIMLNHVHLLVVMMGEYELEDVLYSVKRFSARKINKVVGKSGRVWQKEYYDHIVRDRAELFRTRKYIADNPKKGGLKVGEYEFVSAVWMGGAASNSEISSSPHWNAEMPVAPDSNPANRS